MSHHEHQPGFTLLELVVVIAILALLTQVVVSNMAVLIPRTALDSEASKLSARMDFLRTEARLQGKPYMLRMDMDNHRHKILLPPEDEMIARGTAEEYIELEWHDLNRNVRFVGYSILNGKTAEKGVVDIVFDENGFTADQAIYLALRDDEKEEMIWTVHLQGLSGSTETIRDEDGVRSVRQTPIESDF